jgi:hypothetical protein
VSKNIPLNAREVLTANRTYYVRTDGSNSNSGLTNTAAGAWLTLQYAATFLANFIDFAGFTITVQVGNGTYTAGVNIPRMVGQPSAYDLVFTGDTGTPSNVIVSVTSGDCFVANTVGAGAFVQGFDMRTTTSGNCITVANFGKIGFGGSKFGTCAGTHVAVYGGASAEPYYAYEITGNASYHYTSAGLGILFGFNAPTVTLTGAPAFTQFVLCETGALVDLPGWAFSGAASAGTQRYLVQNGGVINTSGGGAAFFPGGIAGSGGTTAGGGWYA